MMINKGDFLIECYDSLQSRPKKTAQEPDPKMARWLMLEPMSGDFETVIKHCKETNR